MSRFKFRTDVIEKWQSVWKQVCDMAYERKNIVEELVVTPESQNEMLFYARNNCSNAEEITLDYTWKQYSSFAHPEGPLVVPELKRIYVPCSLFECLGVYSWFKHSFPNCEIQYW
jgi:hypothetical protein